MQKTIMRAEVVRKPVKSPKPLPEHETKTDLLKRMMQRRDGATSPEMEKATGWAPHSVRGLVGGLKKRGVPVSTIKTKGQPTRYYISAAKAQARDQVGDVV